MSVTIQIRRDTAANWTAANPVLAIGEMGLETDAQKFKVGDGVTAWNSLGYWHNSGIVLNKATEFDDTIYYPTTSYAVHSSLTINAPEDGCRLQGYCRLQHFYSPGSARLLNASSKVIIGGVDFKEFGMYGGSLYRWQPELVMPFDKAVDTGDHTVEIASKWTSGFTAVAVSAIVIFAEVIKL